MSKIHFMVVFLIILFLPAKTDICVKEKLEIIEWMGQPPHDIIQEEWIGKNRMATIDPSTTIIYDYTLNKMFWINHLKKTYIETDIPVDISKLYPEEFVSIMKKIADSLTFSVIEFGITKKIGDWNCKRYSLTMKMMGMDVLINYWTSTDVPFNWQQYMKMHCDMVKLQFKAEGDFAEEFKKIKGFPIITENKMMELHSKRTVLEISIKEPPMEIYSVPQNYIKEERLTIANFR